MAVSASSDNSDDANSDENDICAPTGAPQNSITNKDSHTAAARWHNAVTQITEYIRDDCFLPLDPTSQEANVCCSDVTTGCLLPLWHCPFKDCQACWVPEKRIHML